MTHSVGSARAVRYAWPLFRAALGSGQTLTLPVNGYCMWPALRPGDKVVVRALEQRPVRVGDVLVCVHGERAVAHRVARLGLNSAGEPTVRCRGDAARSLDAEVRVREVCGVVVGVERANQVVPLAPRRGLVSAAFSQLRSARSVLHAWMSYSTANDRAAEPTRPSAIG